MIIPTTHAHLTPMPEATADLLAQLEGMDDATLDSLDEGVIGFTELCLVDRYNRAETVNSGLSREEVMGRHLFEDVAPCMDNRLVAQRYADAATAGLALDLLLDFVFTYRMQPTPVRLRLLSSPTLRRRYLLVQRA